MKAVDLIVDCRNELKVVDHWIGFIFGYAQELNKEMDDVDSLDLK